MGSDDLEMKGDSKKMMLPADITTSVRRRWPVVISIMLVLFLAGLLGWRLGERRLRERLADKIAEALPKIEERTGLKITLGNPEIKLSGSAVFHEMTLTDAETSDAEPLLTIEQVDISFDLSIRERRAAIKEIKLIRPRVHLELGADGSVNLPGKLSQVLQGDEKTGETTDAQTGWRAMLGKYAVLPDPLAFSFIESEVVVLDKGVPNRREGRILHYTGVNGEATLSKTEAGRFKPEISVTQGDLGISDTGWITDRLTPLLEVRETSGQLTIFPGERRLVLSGRAVEPVSGGVLELAADLDERAQMISVLADQVYWQPPTEWLPAAIQVGNKTRFSGRVTLHRRHDQPLLLVVFNEARFEGLTINHPRLAKDEVKDLAAGLTGELRVDPERRTISGMYLSATLGPARVSVPVFFLRLPDDKPFLMQVRLDTEHLPIQDLLDGLPAGMIPAIKGARVAGYLDLKVLLVVNHENIRESKLDVRGQVTDFVPLEVPTRCDVRRIREANYEHAVFKNGSFIKTIKLGSENPDFVPLTDISPYIMGAVAVCEDGAFFRHHGFLPEAINESLQQNIRAGRFGRGASTITMQLVKNLFLGNEKTVSRKMQEAMLTWWIEREVDKRRMLEVYFNIIEWGNELYGVGPACRHYFQAHPARVNPLQAAWLASIIRDPVRYQRMRGGAVSPGWKGYLDDIMRKMTRRGTITEEMYQDALTKDFEVFLAPKVEEDEAAKEKTETTEPAESDKEASGTEEKEAPAEPLPPFDKPWPPGPTP